MYGAKQWQRFVQQYQATNSGIDRKGIIIHASGHLLERNIWIIDKQGVRKYQGGGQSGKKPAMMLYVKKIGEADFYRPLFQYKETKGALGTSRHVVENDLRFMEKGQVFRKLQEFVNKAGKTKLGAEVVGYMSKVIPEGEREASIWKKESMALIHGLHKFKPLLEISPAVLCLVDSQVVYFLSHNNLLATNLKAKRLGTLLHLEYPNVLVAPVKGKDNISDKLSRLFSLPKVLEDSLALKDLKISDELSEIENKAYSLEEARLAVSGLEGKHWSCLLYTSPSPRDQRGSRMPSSA